MINLLDEHGMLRLDEMVMNNPSWKKIIADDVVTEEEVADQGNVVVNIIKEIDEKFGEEQKQLVERLLAEASVLFTAHHLYSAQQILKM